MARKPATTKPSVSSKIKKLHKLSGKVLSLKQFAKTSSNKEVREFADSWFFNKKANFSNPPQGLGNTGRSNKANQKKVVAAISTK
jgi:hypothetical protein